MRQVPRALAYLSLGANLGQRDAQLKFGLKALQNLPGTSLESVSSLYETEPWGLKEQPAFLNICVALRTELQPQVLLQAALAIELAAGRERRERWGPRLLDIDILTYGEERIEEEGLSLPHPRVLERAFVLRPLIEIAPGLHIGEHSAAIALAKLDQAGIRLIGELKLEDG